MKYKHTFGRQSGAGVGITCCVLAIAVLVAYVVVGWWLTGVILDWADDRFHLGLVGVTKVVVHVVMYLGLGALLSRGGSSSVPKK